VEPYSTLDATNGIRPHNSQARLLPFLSTTVLLHNMALTLRTYSHASHTHFHLYKSLPAPKDLYLVGVWKTAAAHAAYLHSPAAMKLAKAFGEVLRVGAQEIEKVTE
jgi:quinol monooxygenase YgiN